MGRRKIDKSAGELYTFVGNGGPPTNGNRHRSEKFMTSHSVQSAGPIKILSMSNI